MKGFCVGVLLLVIFVQVVISARHIGLNHSHQKRATTRGDVDVKMLKPHHKLYSQMRRPLLKHHKPDTLQIAGSRLPDCSHACGSCTPCRLVMVSFVCSSLAEAETCPMAYKCMCNNKSYPVP